MTAAAKEKPIEEVIAEREAEYASQKSDGQIAAEAAAIRDKFVDEFHKLARRQAMDETVDSEEVAKAATLAGLPLESFPRAFTTLVSQYRHRRTLREKAARLEPSQAEMHEARAAVDAANAALDAAVQLHQRKTEPLQRRIAELRQEYSECFNIPTELLSTCPVPSLKLKNKRILAHMLRLSAAHRKSLERANDLRTMARNEGDRMRAERLLMQADAVDKESKLIEKQVAEACAESEALGKEMIEA